MEKKGRNEEDRERKRERRRSLNPRYGSLIHALLEDRLSSLNGSRHLIALPIHCDSNSNFSNGCKAVLRDCDNLTTEACNRFPIWWKQICCDKRVETGLRLSWDFITATKLIRSLSCYLSDCSILTVISKGFDRKKAKKRISHWLHWRNKLVKLEDVSCWG